MPFRNLLIDDLLITIDDHAVNIVHAGAYTEHSQKWSQDTTLRFDETQEGSKPLEERGGTAEMCAF